MQDTRIDVQHTEAKALGWAKFTDPHGAVWSITLREGCTGEMAAELVANCEGMTKFMLQRGWTVAGGVVPGESGAGVTLCPLHGVAMTRHGKNGDTWYSHKLPDGSWCRGK